MSQPDTDTGGSSESPVAERLLRKDEFAADLNAQGYTDLLEVRRESGRELLTDGRLELLQFLDQHGSAVDSVSDLARQLDRDKGAVSKDRNRLAELDLLKYEGSGDGTAKRPQLKNKHVVIEPVVY